MEKEVLKKMWECVGWDVEKADGIFAPGSPSTVTHLIES